MLTSFPLAYIQKGAFQHSADCYIVQLQASTTVNLNRKTAICTKASFVMCKSSKTFYDL